MDDRRGDRWALVVAGMGLVSLLWPASRADARLLDLSGEVALEYRMLNTDSGPETTSSDDLRETVRVGNNGELFREAIGRYQLNFNFLNEDRWDDNSSWGSGKENDQVLDFFASVNLFPRWMALGLTAQRVTQELESGTNSAPGSGGKITTTTLGLTWALPRIWKLPQLLLNLYDSIIETQGCTPASPPGCDDKSRTFGGSLSAADQYPFRYVIKNTVLNYGISFASVQDVNSGGTELAVSGQVTADTNWTPTLTSNVRGAYSTNLSRQTPSVPGGVATATSAGALLIYRPSLKLTSRLSYDYAKDVGDRHVLGADAFYRPTPQFDISTTIRATLYDLPSARSVMGVGTAVVMYRPTLNLSTTFSATMGDSQTTNSAAATSIRVDSFFQNYGASLSYFKLYDLVRVNTGAGMGVANSTVTGGAGSTTFNSNWQVQVTNTKTQYVTVTGGVNGFYQQSSGNVDIMTNSIRADATSSYFHELLFRGDGLTLHGGVGDQLTTQSGANTQIVDLIADVRYGWQAVGVASGYATHIGTSPGQDFDTYFVEMQWAVPPMLRGMSLLLHGRYNEQLMRDSSQTNFSDATADVTGSYQIGLVLFTLQYQFHDYESDSSTLLSHNLYLRLSRQFSF